MSTNVSPDEWTLAPWMPNLPHELKSIVMVPFKLPDVKRIGKLRAELKQRNYV